MIQGVSALFQDEYYLVGANGLTMQLDYTQWGLTHVILGVVVAAAGLALLVGQVWARVVAVLVVHAREMKSIDA